MNEEFTTQTPATATAEAPRRQSGVGIASFVIGLVNMLLLFVMVAMAVSFAASNGGHMDEHSAQAMMLGLLVILIGLLCLIGTGLGIASVIQKKRRRVFGIIGLCFNGGVLLLIALMMIVGITHH